MTPSGESKRPAKPPARRRTTARVRSSAAEPHGDREPGPSSDRAAPAERGVFASLPSTRPQRPSARRAAAKRASGQAADGQANAHSGDKAAPTALSGGAAPEVPRKTASPRKAAAATDTPGTPPTSPDGAAGIAAAKHTAGRRKAPPRRTAAKTAASARVPREPPVPPQGFESESEIEPGTTVQPPSGAELAASLAELLGDLAHGGVAAGGRLLKDAVGRLRGG